MTNDVKKNIRNFSLDQLVDYFQKIGEPQYRAKQVYQWLWQKSICTFDEMNNISKDLRSNLNKHFVINSLTVDAIQISDDKTIKSRFKLFDNYLVEGVLIPTINRMTACISSQVGCSLSCKFCATGYLDKKRNLNADEIYDQVVLLNKQAIEKYDKSLSNIVFMGMGEPLLNYNNVLTAIDKITSPEGLGMASRRITLSTAGISKMIKKLGDDNVKFKLALSLHAATDEKRNKIMSINETNSLSSLMEALQYFYSKTKRQITFEYILFNNFNDSIEDAKLLVQLCRKVPTKVNVIEYNPIEKADFSKPKEETIIDFVDYLSRQKINARIRRSRGKDIDAACGQLANKS